MANRPTHPAPISRKEPATESTTGAQRNDPYAKAHSIQDSNARKRAKSGENSTHRANPSDARP